MKKVFPTVHLHNCMCYFEAIECCVDCQTIALAQVCTSTLLIGAWLDTKKLGWDIDFPECS